MLPLFLAVTIEPAEQQFLTRALIYITSIGLVGYLSYKIIHVIQETWPTVRAASFELIDFYFAIRKRILKGQEDLRSEFPRALPPDAPPTPARSRALG